MSAWHDAILEARQAGIQMTYEDAEAMSLLGHDLCERVTFQRDRTIVVIVWAIPGLLRYLPPVLYVSVSRDAGKSFEEVGKSLSYAAAGRLAGRQFK